MSTIQPTTQKEKDSLSKRRHAFLTAKINTPGNEHLCKTLPARRFLPSFISRDNSEGIYIPSDALFLLDISFTEIKPYRVMEAVISKKWTALRVGDIKTDG